MIERCPHCRRSIGGPGQGNHLPLEQRRANERRRMDWLRAHPRFKEIPGLRDVVLGECSSLLDRLVLEMFEAGLWRQVSSHHRHSIRRLVSLIRRER